MHCNLVQAPYVLCTICVLHTHLLAHITQRCIHSEAKFSLKGVEVLRLLSLVLC